MIENNMSYHVYVFRRKTGELGNFKRRGMKV